MGSRVVVNNRHADELAVLIRVLREQAQMTQEELSDHSGLSVRTISDMERGRTTKPHRRSIEMLADALGVDLASLEHVLTNPRERPVAQCPSCSARWRLDTLIQMTPPT